MTTGLLSLRFALVLAGWAVGAAQAQGPYRCKDPKTGSTTIQQTPCKDETPPPPTPTTPKKLPCDLNADQVRRASRLETQFLTRFPDEAGTSQGRGGGRPAGGREDAGHQCSPR